MAILRLFRPISVKSAFSQLFKLASLVLVVCAQSALAQSPESRPVARLIAGHTEALSTSRPRRAGATGEATVEGSNFRGSPSIDEASQIERRAFDVTNEERVKNGMAPLVWDNQLCLMARAHSQRMAELGFFAHATPEGLRLRGRARAAGISRYKVLGENIAYNQGYDDPGAFAVERWMISQGHRANILSSEFQSAAIGAFVTSDGTVFLTQLFILR